MLVIGVAEGDNVLLFTCSLLINLKNMAIYWPQYNLFRLKYAFIKLTIRAVQKNNCTQKTAHCAISH